MADEKKPEVGVPNASAFYRLRAGGTVESRVFAPAETPDATWFDSPKKATAADSPKKVAPAAKKE